MPHTKENEVISNEWRVEGMSCTSCASSLEARLNHVPGVDNVSVNYSTRRVLIEYDPHATDEQNFIDAASSIGYNLLTGSEEQQETSLEERDNIRSGSLRKKLQVAILFSLPVFILAMFVSNVPYERWIMLVLSLPVIMYSGQEFYVNAWKRIRHGSTNMDTLVALSTGAAFLFSVFNTLFPQILTVRGIVPHVYYESAVVIITLILLGRYLEERARRGTTSSLKALMQLQPATVPVLRNGAEVELPLSEIIRGDLCLLRPGASVPVDGTIKIGDLSIDESMLTGESVPVVKSNGDQVFAGTVVSQGSGRLLATETGNETLLAGIIRQVREAQSSKPAIQHLVDKVASIFVPGVIILALLAAGIWLIAGPSPQLSHAFTILITVLIIACPCALGLATPTALTAGIGMAATHGILIRNADALEMAHKVDTLILDKTGTLTTGEPRVTEEWRSPSVHPQDISILSSLENHSTHPLAGAIRRHLKEQDLDIPIANYTETAGGGITGMVGNKVYHAGSVSWIMSKISGQNELLVHRLEEWDLKGFTTVVFSDEDEILLAFSLEDTIKPEARDVVTELGKRGISLRLLSGDSERVTAHMAKEIGITEYRGGLSPFDKRQAVEELQKAGHVVAMAGDGINDAEALARADVSIAMGSGTDVAMETAGMTLIRSDLTRLPIAFKLSKTTMQKIRQNLFWAFVYNIIALPVAAGILYPFTGFLINPMVAGAAMALSSVSVVSNSLAMNN